MKELKRLATKAVRRKETLRMLCETLCLDEFVAENPNSNVYYY